MAAKGAAPSKYQDYASNKMSDMAINPVLINNIVNQLFSSAKAGTATEFSVSFLDLNLQGYFQIAKYGMDQLNKAFSAKWFSEFDGSPVGNAPNISYFVTNAQLQFIMRF